ncbi:MAG TPA: BON domain-containing protein, partial [Terriglobales bacterium]|nr:BON domain-containing protein [Terriglobales bacterium]
LFKYAWGAVPPIHIIVHQGRVELYGIVDNESDKNMVLQRAKQVPGTFGVEDHLQVAKEQKK